MRPTPENLSIERFYPGSSSPYNWKGELKVKTSSHPHQDLLNAMHDKAYKTIRDNAKKERQRLTRTDDNWYIIPADKERNGMRMRRHTIGGKLNIGRT